MFYNDLDKENLKYLNYLWSNIRRKIEALIQSTLQTSLRCLDYFSWSHPGALGILS